MTFSDIQKGFKIFGHRFGIAAAIVYLCMAGGAHAPLLFCAQEGGEAQARARPPANGTAKDGL